MNESPEYVVWEALRSVMPRASANHAAHIVVTALNEAGWITCRQGPSSTPLPQPSEVNWDALKPETFESGWADNV